uniref:Uncharacterized protein n=1 Tax=Gibberella zeae TaxID=5518 RepID=A0A4E9DR03_GIBZA
MLMLLLLVIMDGLRSRQQLKEAILRLPRSC